MMRKESNSLLADGVMWDGLAGNYRSGIQFMTSHSSLLLG